jgi:hypothetical protein
MLIFQDWPPNARAWWSVLSAIAIAELFAGEAQRANDYFLVAKALAEAGSSLQTAANEAFSFDESWSDLGNQIVRCAEASLAALYEPDFAADPAHLRGLLPFSEIEARVCNRWRSSGYKGECPTLAEAREKLQTLTNEALASEELRQAR